MGTLVQVGTGPKHCDIGKINTNLIKFDSKTMGIRFAKLMCLRKVKGSVVRPYIGLRDRIRSQRTRDWGETLVRGTVRGRCTTTGHRSKRPVTWRPFTGLGVSTVTRWRVWVPVASDPPWPCVRTTGPGVSTGVRPWVRGVSPRTPVRLPLPRVSRQVTLLSCIQSLPVPPSLIEGEGVGTSL